MRESSSEWPKGLRSRFKPARSQASNSAPAPITSGPSEPTQVAVPVNATEVLVAAKL